MDNQELEKSVKPGNILECMLNDEKGGLLTDTVNIHEYLVVVDYLLSAQLNDVYGREDVIYVMTKNIPILFPKGGVQFEVSEIKSDSESDLNVIDVDCWMDMTEYVKEDDRKHDSFEGLNHLFTSYRVPVDEPGTES